MRIHRHFTDLPPAARGAVLAIGNFDGVHRGHQAVIGEAVRRAKAAGAPSAVLTFEPHPRRFFQPAAPPFLLTRMRTKVRVIAGLGVDTLFILRFDADIAKRSAEAFIDDILVGAMAVRHAVVGYDFVFGQGRRGTPEMLRDRLAVAGAGATVMQPVIATDPSGAADPDASPEALIYSSTGVRDSLRAGDPRGAARLLGRPFEIEGRVRRGDARGRLIGFPTANLLLDDYLHPALGVYAVRAGDEEGGRTVWRDGVANLGLRPTFGGAVAPRLEVHLFDFSGDLYGRNLRVALIDFLRPECKFDGIEALKAQIGRDGEAARAALARPAAPVRVRPQL
ncbi:MAG: bifunctional riboflavin kinase/FAD synthetase [Rhodospirillales bacterium]|nr:bifunctional riboflavin kinase/FAD synthetase [Rhodospirillales bacterium]